MTGADYSILDAKNAILETSVLQPIGQCPIDGERLVVLGPGACFCHVSVMSWNVPCPLIIP